MGSVIERLTFLSLPLLMSFGRDHISYTSLNISHVTPFMHETIYFIPVVEIFKRMNHIDGITDSY